MLGFSAGLSNFRDRGREIDFARGGAPSGKGIVRDYGACFDRAIDAALGDRPSVFVTPVRGVNLFFPFTARLKSGPSRPYVVMRSVAAKHGQLRPQIIPA